MDANQLQAPEVPAKVKTLIHAFSILLAPFIFIIFILSQLGLALSAGDYTASGMASGIVSAIIFAVLIGGYVTFLYYLAGGLDWHLEKLSTIRGLLFFVLSGLIYGLLFYGYWYLVRFVVAKTSKIPFSDIKGKLLTRK